MSFLDLGLHNNFFFQVHFPFSYTGLTFTFYLVATCISYSIIFFSWLNMHKS
jgi:hypothetical protein